MLRAVIRTHKCCTKYAAAQATLELFSPQYVTQLFLSLPACFPLVCLCVQDGGTALTVASQYGHTKVVDTLLKNGANVHDQLNVSPFCCHIFGLFYTSRVPSLSLSTSGTGESVAHNVPAAGIQPLRFLQTRLLSQARLTFGRIRVCPQAG